MDKIIIEPLTKEVLDEIVFIENQCFSNPWSRQSFLSSLNNPLQYCYSASVGNRTVGFIILFSFLEEGEVLNIATHPDYRKQGIASALLEFSFSELLLRGAERITLEVRKSNIPAQKLYKKHGFTEFAVRKNYYSSPLEDGIVMERSIHNT